MYANMGWTIEPCSTGVLIGLNQSIAYFCKFATWVIWFCCLICVANSCFPCIVIPESLPPVKNIFSPCSYTPTLTFYSSLSLLRQVNNFLTCRAVWCRNTHSKNNRGNKMCLSTVLLPLFYVTAMNNTLLLNFKTRAPSFKGPLSSW